MDSTQRTKIVQPIGLLDSLNGEWIKLPMAVIRDVGPAAQTLGGLIKLTNRETFVPVSTIASKARVPLWTCRKHLVTLSKFSYIANDGRGHTRTGRPRRTCTIRLTGKARTALSEYGALPWWACCTIRSVGRLSNVRLSWSGKVLLSLVMAKLMAMKSAIENGDGHGLNADDLWSSLYNMGVENRFYWSLDRIGRETSLSRHSIIKAKYELHKLGIIRLYGGTAEDGGHNSDCLVPNEEFQVIVTPTSEGRCYVDFGGCEMFGRGGAKMATGECKSGNYP